MNESITAYLSSPDIQNLEEAVTGREAGLRVNK